MCVYFHEMKSSQLSQFSEFGIKKLLETVIPRIVTQRHGKDLLDNKLSLLIKNIWLILP